MRKTISIRSGAGFRSRIARPFCFGLQQGPMSVHARLVSGKWAAELVVRAGKDTALRWDLVMSPTNRALNLEAATSDPKRRKGLFRIESR